MKQISPGDAGGYFFFLSFCLRRVTFANSDKSNQKRHSRGRFLGPLWEGAVGEADWGREILMASLPPSPCGRHLPHRGRQTGGAEPLPYGRFYGSASGNRLSLRRPAGDTSLTEGGKREGRGCGAKKGPPVGGPFLSYFARLFCAYLLFSLPK